MKRTTKIIIGLIAFFLLMSVVFIVTLSMVDKSEFTFKIDKPNQLMTLPVKEKYKAVQIINMTEDSDNPIYKEFTYIVPLSQAKREGAFYFPKELAPYVNQYVKNDTLMIEFDYDSLYSKVNHRDINSEMKQISYYLYVDPSVPINVGSDMMNLCLKESTVREVTFFSQAEIFIHSCRIENLHLIDAEDKVTISKSKVKKLDADLEFASSLTTPNSVIGELNVSGGGTHHIDVSKMNYKKINWKGTRSDASLTLVVDSTVSTVSFD